MTHHSPLSASLAHHVARLVASGSSTMRVVALILVALGLLVLAALNLDSRRRAPAVERGARRSRAR